MQQICRRNNKHKILFFTRHDDFLGLFFLILFHIFNKKRNIKKHTYVIRNAKKKIERENSPKRKKNCFHIFIINLKSNTQNWLRFIIRSLVMKCKKLNATKICLI